MEKHTLTLGQVHEFLNAHYKHDRFEGRNGKTWGEEYSMNIARDRMKDISKGLYTCISAHDSKTGEAVWFNYRLIAMDKPPERGWPSNNVKDYPYGCYISKIGCRNCHVEYVGPKHSVYCYECIQEVEC